MANDLADACALLERDVVLEDDELVSFFLFVISFHHSGRSATGVSNINFLNCLHFFRWVLTDSTLWWCLTDCLQFLQMALLGLLLENTVGSSKAWLQIAWTGGPRFALMVATVELLVWPSTLSYIWTSSWSSNSLSVSVMPISSISCIVSIYVNNWNLQSNWLDIKW